MARWNEKLRQVFTDNPYGSMRQLKRKLNSMTTAFGLNRDGACVHDELVLCLGFVDERCSQLRRRVRIGDERDEIGGVYVWKVDETGLRSSSRESDQQQCQDVWSQAALDLLHDHPPFCYSGRVDPDVVRAL